MKFVLPAAKQPATSVAFKKIKMKNILKWDTLNNIDLIAQGILLRFHWCYLRTDNNSWNALIFFLPFNGCRFVVLPIVLVRQV